VHRGSIAGTAPSATPENGTDHGTDPKVASSNKNTSAILLADNMTAIPRWRKYSMRKAVASAMWNAPA
jgi:hypothetical protein